jgi:hypothetical protein
MIDLHFFFRLGRQNRQNRSVHGHI